MNRPLIIAAVLLSACTSCVSHAPPAADFVAEQVVPTPEGNVHAFRVDIVKMDRPAPQARFTLSRIPIDKNGMIASQFKLGSPDGYLVPEGSTIKITAAREETTKQTVLVRLYRPGYRTIEVKPGEKPHELKWIPADVFAQEKAIDDLLGVPNRADREGWWSLALVTPTSEVAVSRPVITHIPTLGDSGLQPGQVSVAHRDALKFAADEYARLAKSIAVRLQSVQLMAWSEVNLLDKTRQRLEVKAQTIHSYANH